MSLLSACLVDLQPFMHDIELGLGSVGPPDSPGDADYLTPAHSTFMLIDETLTSAFSLVEGSHISFQFQSRRFVRCALPQICSLIANQIDVAPVLVVAAHDVENRQFDPQPDVGQPGLHALSPCRRLRWH